MSTLHLSSPVATDMLADRSPRPLVAAAVPAGIPAGHPSMGNSAGASSLRLWRGDEDPWTLLATGGPGGAAVVALADACPSAPHSQEADRPRHGPGHLDTDWPDELMGRISQLWGGMPIASDTFGTPGAVRDVVVGLGRSDARLLATLEPCALETRGACESATRTLLAMAHRVTARNGRHTLLRTVPATLWRHDPETEARLLAWYLVGMLREWATLRTSNGALWHRASPRITPTLPVAGLPNADGDMARQAEGAMRRVRRIPPAASASWIHERFLVDLALADRLERACHARVILQNDAASRAWQRQGVTGSYGDFIAAIQADAWVTPAGAFGTSLDGEIVPPHRQEGPSARGLFAERRVADLEAWAARYWRLAQETVAVGPAGLGTALPSIAEEIETLENSAVPTHALNIVPRTEALLATWRQM